MTAAYGRDFNTTLRVLVTPEMPPVAVPTSVAFTDATARTGQHTDTAIVEARLVDASTDAAVQGAPLDFTLTNGVETLEWTETTDDTGIARRTIDLSLHAGDYELAVAYGGEADRYQQSSALAAFTILPEDTATSLAIEGRGSKKVLVARLTDTDSTSGVASKAITFFGDGTALGTATTDTEGVARFEPPKGKPLDYQAAFCGDGDFVASSTSSSTSCG